MSEINRIELEGLMHDWKSRAEEAEAQVAELARVTAEREEYERVRWNVVAMRNAALNDLEAARAELTRLRAVIEEARGHLEWAGKSMTYKEFNDSVLIAKAILDRVKGDEE